jgi:type IV pilus assembly protein PilQ
MQQLLKIKENSLLSDRGNVAFDERTNTLLVQDTSKNLNSIRELITELDIPIRQVLIESRIVVAASTFARELGVRFGFSGFNQRGENTLVSTSGNLESADIMTQSAIENFNDGGPLRPSEVGGLEDRLNVDLPVQNPAGRLALAILGVDYLLDLELSALQTEGQGEVISNPRVLTGNNQEAIIEQGQETKFIARGDNSSSLDSIQALLQLKVTPTITPDDRVLMKLEIKDDRPGQQLPDRIVIDRRRIVSSVLVDNGETVVIGGIYQEEKTEGETKVPWLGDVPVLGYLFKTRQKNSNRRELLGFITPRIVKEALGIAESRI